MKKRIFLFISIISILSILASVVMVQVVSYTSYQREIESELREQAIALRSILDKIPEEGVPYLNHYLEAASFRVTLIKQDGTVLFDNYADWELMENHKSRPEVEDALLRGFGKASRYSTTIAEKTYYYAIELSNNQILRIARTTGSMYSFFYNSLLIVILLMILFVILAIYFSKSLARRIVDPINQMDLVDFSNCPYEELGSMVHTLRTQKQALKEQFIDIEMQSKTMQTIMDHMHGGLMLTDREGNILKANKGIATMYNFPLDKAQEYNILEVCRELSMLQGLQDCKKGNSKEFTVTHKEKTFQVYMNPVLAERRSVGTIVLLLDISEEIGMEQFRKEFSANVSHELKTPLTSILGYGELMASKSTPAEDMPKMAEHVVQEANRLIRLIEDILILSKLDEGKYSYAKEPINLTSMVEDIFKRVTPQQKKYGIHTTITGDPEATTLGNPQMIDTLLYNIILNGITYNRQGGTLQVDIQQQDSGGVEIRIIDSGIGIPVESQSRIFERFYRVEGSRSKATGGTGLGLSIAKHITRMHRGTLRVESTPNQGSTFIINL